MQKNAPVTIHWVEENQEYVAFNPKNPVLRAYATNRQDALAILEQAQQHTREALRSFARPDRQRLKPTTKHPIIHELP